MEEAKEELLRILKNVVFKLIKKVLIVLILICTPILIFAASVYFMVVHVEAAEVEGDWSSVPFAAGQYISGVSAGEDGMLKSTISAQELWDKMIENGSRVNEYLEGPEELVRLMKAEIVTQYPDTRPANKINDPIDWEEVLKDSDSLQGIIKFDRADSNGSTSTMTYVEPQILEGWIEEYNTTGNEEAKKQALSHFTLRKNTGTSNNINNTNVVTSGKMADVSEAIVKEATKLNTYGLSGSVCQAWVGTVYDKAGLGYVPSGCCAYLAGTKWGISSDFSKIVNGAAIWTGAGTYRGTKSCSHASQGGCGHAGIYYKDEEGNDWALSFYNGSVHKDTLQHFLEYYGQGNTPVWGWQGGISVEMEEDKKVDKKENKKEDKKKDTSTKTKQAATVTQVNGDGYRQQYTSSAGITYKHYKQYEGSYAETVPYWTGTIHSSGCGPTSVTILASGLLNSSKTPADIATEMNANYGFTSFETLKKEMDSLGMTSDVIHNPSADDIKNNLKDGKVMLVSVNSNTIFTGGSHIMAIVDINSKGEVYICNPGSSSLYGWYDTSELMKGCDYIVVTNASKPKMRPSDSNGSGYCAVIATWQQIDTNVTTNDPNVTAKSETQYMMNTTNINYEEMVDTYTMPFDLLWAFLVIGEDKNFIFELTDLIYNSDIRITIHDNLTVYTDIDEWNYTQKTKAIVNGNITASCDGKTATDSIKDDIHDPDSVNPYQTTKTVVTKTNTVDVALTRANTWIVDYQNNYTYVSPKENKTGSKIKEDDQEYKQKPDSIGNTYSCEHIKTKKKELRQKVKKLAKQSASEEDEEEKLPSVTFDDKITVEYYNKYINISDTITNNTKTQSYKKGTPNTREKTDPKAKEVNFSTIFNKYEYRKNKSNFKDVSSWLFEIIESNEGISDMLDLVKYLLYKATGDNYGIKKYDFSEFDPSLMNNVVTGAGANYASLNLTSEDLNILYKITSAERGGGTQQQQEYVVSVILNRVLSSKFPNTVSGVVFAPMQFQPTRNGQYNAANPSQTTINAVNNVVATGDKAQYAVYFMTPLAAKGQPWLQNCIYLFNDAGDIHKNDNSHGTHNFYTTQDIKNELQQYN